MSALTCIFAFITPFFFRSCQDTILSVLSISFTAAGTVATIWTLVIAFYLFDRFGLDTKFIEKKTDKVLDLVNQLKGKSINAHSDYIYIIRPSRIQLEQIRSLPQYQNDKTKKVLFSIEDYDTATREITDIMRDYWLPEEIKSKMQFLKILGYNKFNDNSFDKYIRLDFNAKKTEKNWVIVLPEMTLESFTSNLDDLIATIENWLSKHSGIELNLKMEEEN